MVATVVDSMMAKRVDGGVVRPSRWSRRRTRPWHSVDTDILVEATVIGWRMRDVGNDASLPTRVEGVEIFKKSDSSTVGMSRHKPRRALEKFRKSGADPAFAERRLARIASKAEVKVRDADRARQAERVRPYGQSKPAESANREVTLDSC